MNYGINLINAPSMWPYSQGEGVIVAVIDSGVHNHPDLVNNIIGGRSFCEPEHPPEYYGDGMGHGTHIAGIIVGIAPKVKILALKIKTDDDQTVNMAGLEAPPVRAILYAIEQKVDFINISMNLGNSARLHEVIKLAESKGIKVIASAGNDGDKDPNTDEINYPATYPEVISVGALDEYKQPYNQTNSNTEIDTIAPGVKIYSTYHSNVSTTAHATFSGTSMAAPHVTATLALLKSATKLSSDKVVKLYYTLCIDVGLDPRIQGKGMVDLSLFKMPEKPVEIPAEPTRILPIKNAVITNIYGAVHERYKAKGYHMGIDFIGDSDILSTDSGYVYEVGWDPTGWGKNVIIRTAHYDIIYAHLASVSVSQGQKVNVGTKLGVMGSTGLSTAIHLHYEVRKMPYNLGNEINPAEYLKIKNELGIKEASDVDNLVLYGGYDDGAARVLAHYLQCPIMHVEHFFLKPISAKQVYMIGGSYEPTNSTILLSGPDRYATMQAVLNFIGGK